MLRWSAESPLRTVLLLLCAAATVYFTFAIAQRTAQLYGMHQERLQLEREISALEAREQRLSNERDRLIASRDIEAIARQEMNLIKPGETAVIVYPPPGSSPPPRDTRTASPSAAPAEDNLSWWQRLLPR